MLTKYPGQRISAMESLQHEFFSDFEQIEETIMVNLEEFIKNKQVMKQDKQVADSFITRDNEINGKMDTIQEGGQNSKGQLSLNTVNQVNAKRKPMPRTSIMVQVMKQNHGPA